MKITKHYEIEVEDGAPPEAVKSAEDLLERSIARQPFVKKCYRKDFEPILGNIQILVDLMKERLNTPPS